MYHFFDDGTFLIKFKRKFCMDKNPVETFPAQFHRMPHKICGTICKRGKNFQGHSDVCRCNLLYPVWPRVYSSSVPRQIGGFLTARTKYMTGAPADVEVKPPPQNCPGARTGAENARKPIFWPRPDILCARKMIPI